MAYLSCTSKRNKVYYDVRTINKATDEILRQVLNQLDTHRLLADSEKKIKEIKKAIKQEQDKTDTMFKQIQDELLFSQKDYDQDWSKKEEYQVIQNLQKRYQICENELHEKQQLLSENQYLHELTIKALKNMADMNIKALLNLLVQDIRLYDHTLEVNVQKFDYIKDFNQEIMLNVEEST